MAPLAAPKTFFLSTLWTVSATSSGAAVVLAKMTFITVTDRTSLVV